jgi:hypothetical protein
VAKYQLVGSVDQTSRIERVKYAEDKFLELNGEPQTLSDAQYAKVSQHVELRRIEDGAEPVADFGPDQNEKKDDPPKGGSQGRS